MSEPVPDVESLARLTEGEWRMLVWGRLDQIPEIREQATKTNGRVTALERWRYGIGGALLAAMFPAIAKVVG